MLCQAFWSCLLYTSTEEKVWGHSLRLERNKTHGQLGSCGEGDGKEAGWVGERERGREAGAAQQREHGFGGEFKAVFRVDGLCLLYTSRCV